LLTRFQKENLIKVDGKLIEIIDFETIYNRSQGLHNDLLIKMA
jgi:hypothetical protein